MEKRPLGNTGEQVSILGIGGFHLLEIGLKTVEQILNRYLDAGGNYIESSQGYGDGVSEQRIGRLVSSRRKEFLLATKVDERDRQGALRILERSLRYLRTDHIDLWFMHAIQKQEDAERILGSGGALEAAEEAKQQGKVRFIGISGHGQPVGLLHALQHYPFDAVLVATNYYDHFNFPDVQKHLFPLAHSRGTALIGMKAVGDGYLWRSAPTALRYAWSLPISLVVAGINTVEMLEQDLAFAERFTPMSSDEIRELYDTAPEYRNYVCRQCDECQVTDALPLKRIFELEGWFDRQMWDGIVNNPEDYSLRVRLGTWFGQQQLARDTYAREGIQADVEKDYLHLNGLCPYGIDINRKLKISHSKLTSHWLLH